MWRRRMLDRGAAGQGGRGAGAIAAGVRRVLSVRFAGLPVARFLRQVAGMPDYAAHVEHLRRCHPEGPVPTEREFYGEFVLTRYGDGTTRCC